jgi:DNA-directed RNA polymerase beta subunit
MARLDPAETFENLKIRVKEEIKANFPQEGDKNILEIKDVSIKDEASTDNVTDQKSAKLRGRTWGVPVHATMVLRNKKTGKVIDERTQKIATLPKVTNRYSWIVDGSEFQIDNQWRLKPGVYTKVKQNGELQSFFNVKGTPLHVDFDPKTRVFKARREGANPPLYPIMKALGVSDDALEKKWGKDILAANKMDKRGRPVNVDRIAVNFAAKLAPPGTEVKDMITAAQVIKDSLGEMDLDPKVTKRTLGKPITKVDSDSVLRASGRLLGIARGAEEPDTRDSLMFKDFMSVEDFIGERIQGSSKVISRRIKNNLDRRTKIRDVVGPDIFQRPVKEFFTKVSLASTPEQTNPLKMISGQMRTTIAGEGGVKDANRITEDAKLVDPSHFGVLDPLHTPESSKTGVNLQLALGARKSGDEVKLPLVSTKTGKIEYVTPEKVYDSVVALPDEVKRVGKKFVAKKGDKVKASAPGNELQDVKMDDVQYVVPRSSQMFSIATNMVPFISSDSPNRATMAGRHMEQAIPLIKNEEPLVQSMLGNRSFDDMVGQFASHRASVDGKVVSVGRDSVVIQSTDKKKHRVPVYNNYPLNDKKGFIDSTPVVKAGDVVKKGQLIADTNYTRKGVYAPGTNMEVGYMPWKGYNFEDGVVISDSAATKLTSEHMYKKGLSTREAKLAGKKKFQSYYPDRIDKAQMDKLDEDGVVQVGQKIKPGDTLVTALAERKLTTEEQKMRLLHKSLVQPYKDKSMTWEEDYEGEVVEVVKQGKRVDVHVKTKEPMQVGDKLVGRHGNKGIVTQIVPDEEMPKTKDGKKLEVLMNPIGTPGRMNIGQVCETAAGKIAAKRGKPFKITNFEVEDNLTHVENELKKEGLSDKEDVVDPATGKTIPNIQVGKQYILKLEHQVGKKMAARDRDSYDRNLVPKGGGPHGAQALGSLGMYAMLAHGAKANIREMQTYKSDKSQGGDNDDLWAALQAGEMLPPPKVTFSYKKLESYLKGMGVNTEKDGNSLNLVPLTDKQVLEMSNGELKDPGRVIKMRTLQPEKGGLLDPKITGGHDGTNWSHIKLTQAMPNPLFEKAIMSLSGVRGPQYDRIINGEDGVTADGKIVPGKGAKGAQYGPAAVGSLLQQVDVKKKLAEEEARIPNLKGQLQNESRRRVKFLRALNKLDMKPTDAYMMKHVPVLPPNMRPIAALEDGSIQTDDLNEIYKNLGIVNKKLGEVPKGSPGSVSSPMAADVYDHLKALTGLGGSLNRKHPGFINIIAGREGPKSGYAQDVLIKRKMDMTARSTIVPEPSLSLDEAEIPRKAAKEMYKPFIVRELRRMAGMTPLAAKKAIEQDDPLAQKALERVVKERPVLLKRDPVLHKYGIQAFKPRLVEGKAIKIHPLVCSGFNADFDGDQQLGQVLAFVPAAVYNADYDFWEHRRVVVSARFDVQVGAVAGNGEFVLCDLSEFPHLDEKLSRDHIDFHRVPAGVRVVALDEDRGEPVLAEVSGWSFHRSRKVEVVTLGSGRQIVTDDDERAVYGVDASSLEWCRRRPAEARDQFVPVLEEAVRPSAARRGPMRLPVDRSGRLMNEALLDFEFGYFIGAVVGDGWVVYADNNPKGVALSSTDEGVDRRWRDSTASVFLDEPQFSYAWLEEGKLGNSDGSGRTTVSCAALGRFMSSMIGRGAANKHLPPFFCTAPEKFIRGLLSGMWDTDGSISWSNAKGKPQLMCSYGSCSIRLVQELQHLLRVLGVASTITPSSTPKGKPFWLLGVSSVDLHDADGMLMELVHSDKARVLREFLDADRPDSSMAYSRYRLVPIPSALASELRSLIGSKHRSMYVTLSKAIGRQYMSKEMGLTLLDMLKKLGKTCAHPLFKKWAGLVTSPSVHFERVVSVDVTGIEEDGYDLTVPGYETFMNTDGVVLSNTMSATIPITEDAVKEAREMFPSRNLFSPATSQVMYTPSHEAQVGLFMMAEVNKKTNLSFKDQDALRKAVREGKLGFNDMATVGGVKTTLGRLKLDGTMPKQLQGGALLKDPKYRFTKSEQSKVFNQMARADPKAYAKSSNRLKDLGNKAVSLGGFSFGIEDFKVHRDVRDPILKGAAQKAAKLDLRKPADVDKFVDTYEAAMNKIDAKLKERVNDPKQKSMLAKLEVAAGIKGRGYRQLTAAPVLFVDAKRSVVTSPVTRSYSEGLSSADYWAATSGGRKGAIQRVQSVSEPGYMTKLMMNSTMDQMVAADDCKTERGISLSTDEPDILGRYTMAEVKLQKGSIPAGTMITPDLLTRMKNSKVSKAVVRSPMRCNHAKGVCAQCMGLSESGQLHDKGTNVGVLAAQSLGERGTQLAMKAFRSGGVYEGRKASEKAIETILKMKKKVKGSATLAQAGGKITAVSKDPAGGFNVSVGGTRNYVPANRKMKSGVRVGSVVRKGDPLTHGPINPHDMLPLTGMSKVQGHLAGELHSIYGQYGIRRRNSEMMVRALSNVTKVEDRGDHPDLLPGDFASTSQVYDWNKKAKGGRPVKHRPVLRGVNQIPLDVQTDWMARLNHEHLKDTLIDAAQQGWQSNLHGQHPIPPLIRGAEFGRGTKDAPWAY